MTQTIALPPEIDGAVAGEMRRLYEWADAKLPAEAVSVGARLQPVLDRYGESLPFRPRAAGADLVASAARLDLGKAVVLFSGGKDSTAVALRLREQGARVALLYVRSVNGPSYSREETSAREVAGHLGFPLRVVAPTLGGKRVFPENPAKNLLFSGIAAEFALLHGAGTVALGALRTDFHSYEWGTGMSDDVVLLDKAAGFFEALGLRFLPSTLASDVESFSICRSVPGLLDLIGSCMTGPRAHRTAREANERKFGLELRPGRCGSCFKCCFEIVCDAAIENRVLDAPLARHCLDRLRRWGEHLQDASLPPSEVLRIVFDDFRDVDPRAALSAALG